MKRRACSLLFVAVLGVAGAAPAPAAGIADLGWLAGCWAPPGAEPGTLEQWTAPAGGTMLGVNRTVKAGRTTAHEFIQIRENEDGELEYVARPSGQAGATFTAIKIVPGEVVFENPEHDFPQRVIYRLTADGMLAARIEGEVNGAERAVDFPMQPTACAEQQEQP